MPTFYSCGVSTVFCLYSAVYFVFAWINVVVVVSSSCTLQFSVVDAFLQIRVTTLTFNPANQQRQDLTEGVQTLKAGVQWKILLLYLGMFFAQGVLKI